MNLLELKGALRRRPDAAIRFQLPDGSFVASHAHVTEAARIDKKFIDCGGTFRESSYCRLQTWVADDKDHRLTAKKLLGILEKAGPMLQADDLTVDIEHEVTYISQFPLEEVTEAGNELILRLGLRHTECLAPEKCCPPQPDFVSLRSRGR